MALPEDTILENRYRIDRLLGQGGMGAIYRGFDIRLKRQVAIKENFFQTPQAIQQFEREALMLANLTHPNLPRVGDHFSYEGQQYLVMDFIGGQDLWETIKLQDHPLNESQALDYIIQVCGAVQYLHTRKPPIIHRDIKPQNIKITPEGQAVLVDFGIAKMAEGGQRTSTGARGVTPGFSPLEQYAGSGTSPVSDVYSLGATLYALLTGQKPPDSASRMINQVEFVPPAKLNVNLSERVSLAIEHAMQPQPVDRPPSVAVWQQELEAIQATATTPFAETLTLMTPIEKADIPTTPPPPILTAPATSQPAKSSPLWLLIGGAIAIVIVIIVLIGAITFFVLSNKGDDIGPGVAAASTPTEEPTPTATLDTETTIAAAIEATKLAEPSATPLPEPSATPLPEPSEIPTTPTPLPQTIVADDGATMILIPAGPFEMGSESGDSDEQPVHTVTLTDFYIDKFEVTNAQLAQCVADGGCQAINTTSYRKNASSTRDYYYGNPQYDDYPAIYVSYRGPRSLSIAQEYCKWRGDQLPTEAQWEKAARGTDGRTYPWGEQIPNDPLLNFNEHEGDTMPVGSYPDGVSPYGVHDMAGNVAEYVRDGYELRYYSSSPSTNPYKTYTSETLTVLRGGSWKSSQHEVRTTERSANTGVVTDFVGFRCVHLPLKDQEDG